MTSIKSLITETEKEILWTKNKCPLCNSSLVICCIPNEETYYECKNGHTHKMISEDILNDRNKHLKLCQEIQDAKVEKLKEELFLCPEITNETPVFFIIDKIFGEETNSQQNETATPERESEVSKEISLEALKSKSNKRDGSSADSLSQAVKDEIN